MRTMSRRSFVGLMATSTAIALAGCSGQPSKATPAATGTDTAIPAKTAGLELAESDEPMEGIDQGALVVYFSCTGVTQKIAGYAAEALEASTYRIEAHDPYTSDDIAYYTDCRADREQADAGARPQIAGSLPDLSGYSAVILGYPIWHGRAPRIISTFLESTDLTGKTIAPFCTSHSSGVGSSAPSLESLCPDARWLPGRRFAADSSEAEVTSWLEGEGLAPAIGAAGAPAAFNLGARTVALNDGRRMPTNGLGTYSLKGVTCVASVKAALESGVRLLDTAHIYGNEVEVGRAVRESGVPREEVFVITKLYPSQFSNPEAAISESLEKLDLGYVDMMLLHHPGADDVKAYKAMERARENGSIRSLGLSCFYEAELERFLPEVSVAPALVQNEIHPYYQDSRATEFIHANGIAVQAWYPLGGRGHNDELLSDPALASIAAAHDVSIPQVILRWNLQRGVVVIPGSSNPAHIREDHDIYGFELTDEEMAAIAALDRNEKHDWY